MMCTEMEENDLFISFTGNNADVLRNLQRVSYSSRYAMGLFFPPEASISYPWTAKYVSGNPCVRYIAVDQAKRGVGVFTSLFILMHAQ